MDLVINQLSEQIKIEFTKLWDGKALDRIALAIKDRFPDLKKKRLTFSISIDVVVGSLDRKGQPVLRFPLASLATGVGLPDSISKKLIETKDEVASEEKDEKALGLFKRGERNPTYVMTFGIVPSLAHKDIEVCETCKGAGIRLH